MIKIFALVFISLILFIGCGSGDSSSDTNRFKDKQVLGYYGDLVLFGDYLISGVWIEYEYDGDELEAISKQKYKFDSNGTRSLTFTIIEGIPWIPAGDYGVSADGQKLYIEEINSTGISYYQFISQLEEGCAYLSKYENNDTNSTYFKWCKE